MFWTGLGICNGFVFWVEIAEIQTSGGPSGFHVTLIQVSLWSLFYVLVHLALELMPMLAQIFPSKWPGHWQTNQQHIFFSEPCGFNHAKKFCRFFLCKFGNIY